MPVLHLTIFISIVLTIVFIVCYVMEAWRNKNQGIEQTSLLPLADDDGDISAMEDFTTGNKTFSEEDNK